MNLSIICCNAQIHYSQTTLQTCASQGKLLRAPPEIRGSDSHISLEKNVYSLRYVL